MTVHTFLFEAKSIHSYIMQTNRLKEIVGASELLESLTGDEAKPRLIDAVLKVLGFTGDEIWFSRRSGSAFYAFAHDEAAIRSLAHLWTLALQHYAPGLEFVSAYAEGETEEAAFVKARDKLASDANRRRCRLPVATPFATRSRRSGDVAQNHIKAKGGGQAEPVDDSIRSKLRFAQATALGERFGPANDDKGEALRWPVLLSPDEPDSDEESSVNKARERGATVFPFLRDQSYMAVVYADGNGLGQLVREIRGKTKGDQFAKSFLAFSKAIDQCAQGAAQAATEKHLSTVDNVYPARPVVLGGEDVSIIVRADLALSFTTTFLQEFEALSEMALTKLKSENQGGPLSKLKIEKLTACAGIAYVKRTQPFHDAFELSDRLCKLAKLKAKAVSCKHVPSSLSFHRVTTSLISEGEAARLSDIKDNERTYRPTLNCYRVTSASEGDHLPPLEMLSSLDRTLQSSTMGGAVVRELLGTMGMELDEAQRRYRRLREVVQRRDADSGQKTWSMLEGALSRLIKIDSNVTLPFGTPKFGASEQGVVYSPLGDVQLLDHVRRDAQGGQNVD